MALIGECSERAGLEVSEELEGDLADLAGDYQPVRYPDALPGGTPSMHYGRAQADRAASAAADLLGPVERQWRTLVDEADRTRAASDEAALDDEGPAG